MSSKVIPWSKVIEKKKSNNLKNKNNYSYLDNIKIIPINFKKNIDVIWLFCPCCKTMQYTFVCAPDGRKHNLCGNLVKEIKIKIDTNFDSQIAKYNIKLASNLLDLSDINQTNQKKIEDCNYFLKIINFSEQLIALLEKQFANMKLNYLNQFENKQLIAKALENEMLIDKWGFIYSNYLASISKIS